MTHGALDNRFWYNDVNKWWRDDSVCTPPSEHNGVWSSWRARKNRDLTPLFNTQFDGK